MTMFPARALARWLAVSWILAALVVLGLMLLRPELQADERRALSSLVPLYFLSFPFGHAGLMACNKLKLELYLDSGFVPGIYAEGMVLWIVLTVLGYAQWFVVLPWICRKSRQLHAVLFTRDPAR